MHMASTGMGPALSEEWDRVVEYQISLPNSVKMVFERFTRAKTSSQKRFSQPIRLHNIGADG